MERDNSGIPQKLSSKIKALFYTKVNEFTLGQEFEDKQLDGSIFVVC